MRKRRRRHTYRPRRSPHHCISDCSERCRVISQSGKPPGPRKEIGEDELHHRQSHPEGPVGYPDIALALAVLQGLFASTSKDVRSLLAILRAHNQAPLLYLRQHTDDKRLAVKRLRWKGNCGTYRTATCSASTTMGAQPRRISPSTRLDKIEWARAVQEVE